MDLLGWYSLPSVVEIHAVLEAIAVIFFAALVVFDVWAHFNHKHERLLEGIGLICFAVAVLAEVGAYPYSRRVDTLSSAANGALNKEAADARKKAGAAVERAGKALKDAGDANKETRELGIRLESEKQKTARFQKAADDARLALENRIRIQGPRYALLRSAAPRLAKDLSRFSGQRVTTLICGLYEKERETLETWGSLASILGADTVNGVKGADWKPTPGSNIWGRCGLSMQGISVIISPESPKPALDAASALSEGLDSVLTRYNKNPWVISSAWVRLKRERGFGDRTEPESIAFDNPGTIVVYIGEHPPL